MLEYLKIMEWKFIDMFSTPSVVRKINNVNYKDYVKNEEIDNRATCHAEAILDSFKLVESDEVKTENLSEIPPIEGEEQVKSNPE